MASATVLNPEYRSARAQRLAAVGRLQRLARVLDAQFRIPGTGWRFGLDSIVGLVPGIGDFAGASVSAWIIVEAVRLGAPKITIVRMIGNVLIDFLVGSIPVLGDVFDVAFKTNRRNVDLLLRQIDPATGTFPGRRGRSDTASAAADRRQAVAANPSTSDPHQMPSGSRTAAGAGG